MLENVLGDSLMCVFDLCFFHLLCYLFPLDAHNICIIVLSWETFHVKFSCTVGVFCTFCTAVNSIYDLPCL